MFIELIDHLRCTSTHEESWLVAAITARADRFIQEATLGCPICLRQFPVVGGIAYFGITPGPHAVAPTAAIDLATDADGGLRVAAYLGAAERSTLVLAGGWAPHAHAVTELVSATIFALGPTSAMDDSPQVGLVQSSEGIPLAAGAVHGVALDVSSATPRNVASALRVLKPGGRLVAPVSIEPPAGIALLASDESYWVGETGTSFVPLQRA